MLYETWWFQKYRSIGTFKEHYVQIVKVKMLEKLSKDGNNTTAAFQIHCTATNSEFIISVCLIAKYSALLQLVVNALQSISMDLLQCANHIKRITGLMKNHHGNACKSF